MWNFRSLDYSVFLASGALGSLLYEGFPSVSTMNENGRDEADDDSASHRPSQQPWSPAVSSFSLLSLPQPFSLSHSCLFPFNRRRCRRVAAVPSPPLSARRFWWVASMRYCASFPFEAMVVLVIAGEGVNLNAIEEELNKQCQSLPRGEFAGRRVKKQRIGVICTI
ncbi:hypothetical protein PIB30_005023 [Stylosanthes scabra]|uniref:Uncharacterized protein n=1 Tax=Stylosanthes scabra TaxID=79078 RepID=A0ABU6Y5M3_9FABA|nr:hypothetical protein [Stylosanthes scabra]